MASVLFGLVGCICPILLLADAGSPFKQASGGYLDLAPLIIALLAHLYLILVGATLLSGRRPGGLKYFFAVESTYAILLLLLLPAVATSGMVSPASTRWAMNVSIGFFVQVLSGFPLWGWLLTRRRQRDLNS